MGVHFDRARERWVVRRREAGCQLARRFASATEAKAFDARVAPAAAEPVPDGAGVYATGSRRRAT